MSSSLSEHNQSQRITRYSLEAFIRIGLIALLAIVSLNLLRPFLVPIAWGVIIAVALNPVNLHLSGLLGNRVKLASTLFTLLALLLLIAPTVMLGLSMSDSVQEVAGHLDQGTLALPAPPATVADWPLVGERLHAAWSLAANNLEAAIKTYTPQIKSIGRWLLGTVTGVGMGVLQFVVSLIIAGVLMAGAERNHQFTRKLFTRLAGERGDSLTGISIATIRSVAQGVVGIAIIQALLSGIGMMIAGVPGAGLWALLVLLLAIMQLPPILILGPVMVYLFSLDDSTTAVLFMIWGILVSASDGVLKPFFLGRGMDIPMPVILIGAIGGMITSGIIGLFIGAVLLALAYQLFMLWLEQGEPGDAPVTTTEEVEEQ